MSARGRALKLALMIGMIWIPAAAAAAEATTGFVKIGLAARKPKLETAARLA
jgi:hypothetical protein